VDCVPTPQQNTANAWAGGMIGVGNVIGYMRLNFVFHCAHNSGYINLPRLAPSLGGTQFQILCILAPVSLVGTAIITCFTIKEPDPALLFTLPGQEDKGGLQAALGVKLSSIMLTVDANKYHPASATHSSDLQHSIFRLDRLVSVYSPNQCS
jgi:hypothetical protein